MSDVVATLDDWGQPAWIAVMVLGFVVFWPIGLAVLAYLIWSGRMGCSSKRGFGNWGRRMRDRYKDSAQKFTSSGNNAFDEYREATMRRLEDEEREFRDFLARLRQAKDRAEFDEFMKERRNGGTGSTTPPGPSESGNRGPDMTGGTVPQTP